ncbi:MAG: hypothetical protein ACKOBG_12445 [Actinomycetota bacterium]
MVAGLAFVATAVATVFAQATAVRWSRSRAPHQAAWTVSLAMFALASAALATGAGTGWDGGTFRVFYGLGAILTVPWLALGTIFLLGRPATGRRVRAVLLVLSGLAVGVMLATPIDPALDPTGGIPVGKDHLAVLPRILAAAGSGLGALVVFAGAAWSAVRFARRGRAPGAARLCAGNVLIALGVLVLSGGGTIQGVVGHDEAFALTLAVGIVVIYAGFVVASGRSRDHAVERSAISPRVPQAAQVDHG